MKKILMASLFGFLLGFFVSDITHNYTSIQPVHAEVAGMDSYDLKYDYDFKNAVRMVVEDSCNIVGRNNRLELD